MNEWVKMCYLPTAKVESGIFLIYKIYIYYMVSWISDKQSNSFNKFCTISTSHNIAMWKVIGVQFLSF